MNGCRVLLMSGSVHVVKVYIGIRKMIMKIIKLANGKGETIVDDDLYNELVKYKFIELNIIIF